MATTGVDYILSEEGKGYAIKYVEESGFCKTRLADFLEISRPTLDKLLEENPDLFASLKRADTVFCKMLIDKVVDKNPLFLLKTRYKDEFNENINSFDPEVEIQRIMKRIEEVSTKDTPDVPQNAI